MKTTLRHLFLSLCLLAAPMVAGAQSLVFHHCGGGETVVKLPATWSLSGGKIVVSGGGTQVEIAKSEVLTVSYRAAEGDVNGDERVDIGDVATIIGLIGNGGSDTGHAPAAVEAVDLGLPSGTKWANMNVGAEKPEDYGLFFAWGETTGYGSDTTDGRQFYWASYKWMNEGQSSWQQVNKYQVADGQTSGCWYDGDGNFIGDGKPTLDLADDAARANWGGQWVMPTYEDMRELFDNTTSKWTTVNGINGRKFTSKTNGNSIFLPAAGCRDGSSLDYQTSRGYYWSSSVYSSFSIIARSLYFNSGGAYTSYNFGRFYGFSVRPVLRN